MKLLTINEAAAALGVSPWAVRDLVDEAYTSKKSRWKEGREFINLATLTAQRRLIRIRPSALGLEPQASEGSD